jgi:5-methylcytosine-specific restriction endonuclease McrA
MNVFRQSPRVGLAVATCRYCSAPAEPGSQTCEAHAGEAGRLAADPRRAGYRDPAYQRARRQAIRRAAGRCEACGELLQRLPNGRPVCQTHHIDGDPRNNDPANLLVCCRRCHSGSRHPD